MADGGAKVGSAYVEVTPKAAGGFESLLEKEIGNGTERGERFGSAFSGGLKGMVSAGAVAVGNILADMVEAGASLAKDILGDAFSGASEYEQLSGGAQKIFDDMDYATILDDANRAYQELNMSANEYLGSINEVGATFAQTMGDQAGYDTARAGMQAISDYATGTGRDIGELNEKYKMITRSTGSYQSIADQFSGILPATSADFLEQAQAAGLLSESYESLTDVPVAEYQQAVTGMLERGVEGLGLAGNTVAESTKTVSGSLEMMKAAWSDWLTSLGSEDIDTSAATSKLLESVQVAGQNVIPLLQGIVSNVSAQLPGMVSSVGPILIPAVVSMVSSVVPAIVSLAPTLLQGGMQLFLGLVQAAVVMLPQVAQTVIAAAPSLYLAGLDFFRGLGQAFGDVAPLVVDAVVYLITHLPEIVMDGFALMLDAGSQMFFGFIEGITGQKLPAEATAGSMAESAAAAAAEGADASAAGEALTNSMMASFDFSAAEAQATSGMGEVMAAATAAADGTQVAEALGATTAMGIDTEAMVSGAQLMTQNAVDAALAVDSSVVGREFSSKAAGGIDASAMADVLAKAAGGVELNQVATVSVQADLAGVAALQAASGQVSSAYASMASSVESSMGRAANAAASAAARIRGAIAIPDKTVYVNVSRGYTVLPHFSMSGTFDAKTGAVPSVSVSWWEKGGIFTKPAIIGLAEGREPEGVFPLSKLEDFMNVGRGSDGGMDVHITLNYDASADANQMVRDIAAGIRSYNLRR